MRHEAVLVLGGGAGDEAHVGADFLEIHVQVHFHLQPAGRPDQQRHQKHADGDAHRHGAVGHGVAHQGPEALFAEALEGGVEALAQLARLLPAGTFEGVAQVAGEDQEALDQGRADDHQHDQRDLGEGRVFRGDERREGAQRGQGRRHHRREHALGASGRRLRWRLAGVELREGFFADHDGVVHDDAQGHDEADQADGVDGAAEVVEAEQGGQEGHRNAHRHPEGRPHAQEHHQGDDDEREAAETVADDQPQFVADEGPRFQEEVEGDAFRQGGALGVQVGVEVAGSFQRVRFHVAAHEEGDCRLAADRHVRLVDEAAPLHLGDVAQAHQAAGRGGDRQVLELGGTAALIEAAQLPGEVAGADGAAGRVRGERGELGAEFGEGEAQFEQRAAVHLDGDLLGRQADELHRVDAAAEQFVLHFAHQRDEFLQAAAAGDQHRRHQIALAQGVDRRRFDVRRQAADLRDALLDAIHGVLHVRLRLDFHFHEGGTVAGDAPHRSDVRDGLQLLFERRRDELLHVLGTGAAPADLRVDVGARLVGVQLHPQLGNGPDASQHHQRHAEVGGQAMLDESAYQVHSTPSPLGTPARRSVPLGVRKSTIRAIDRKRTELLASTH